MKWIRGVLGIGIAGFLGTAQADEGGLHLGVGAGSVINDPFLKRYITQVTLDVRPKDHMVFEVVLGYSPDLGTSDWRPITKQLIEENHVSPDISKFSLYGGITGRVIPFWSPTKNGHNNLGFLWGVGMVQTEDDLEALQAIGNEVAEATQFETHLMGMSGVMGEAWRGGHGLQMGFRLMTYIETVNSTTLEMKANRLLTLAYVKKL